MPSPKVLTPSQIEQFVEEGFTYLRGGFPRSYAEPVLQQVWDLIPAEMNAKRDDPSTWTQPFVSPRGGPKGDVVSRLYTPRVRGAFDDLLVEGKWVERGERTGAWPIALPGHATGAWRATDGWHIDGGGQRRINGPQQALIAIMLFSDIGPGDGGTAIRPGSHKTSSRVLQQAEPNGLTTGELNGLGPRAAAHLPVVEVQGQIGDLALCHAYIVHSSSVNLGTRPRVITNNCIALHQPMNLSPDNLPSASPLERSIILAIRDAQPAEPVAV